MTRIDGFLIIDKYPKEIAYEHHKKTNHYWVNINGEEYYFKPTDFYYNELLAYHTAKFLGIEACYTDLAILNGEKGIISKSLRKNEKTLISGHEIIKEYIYKSFGNLLYTKKMIQNSGIINWIFDKKYREKKDICAEYINNLEIIWQILEDKYKNDPRFNAKTIIHKFVLMYIFTILVYDCDRYACNWLIQETNNNISLAPLFDNEDAFNYTHQKMSQNTNPKFTINTETSDYNQLASLKVFLTNSSTEYLELFTHYFEELSENFNLIIERAETQIKKKIPENIKTKILYNFNINKNQIQNILNKFNHKKRH